MKPKLKPWDERWHVGQQIGGGGQGNTYHATRRTDGHRGVLKTLKNQTDPERRARMHREATALETCAHPGIPRLLDSNTDRYTEPEVLLFIVLEHVEGATLGQVVEEAGPLGEAASIDLVQELLAIVRYVHSIPLVHRDIKPDNIVLRERSPRVPVLIDFGQCFNTEDDEAPNATYTGQQLGNRFLHLPELIASGDQRDMRSDIAQCCGILFLGLTGASPQVLVDGQRQMPHQRGDAPARLGRLPHGPGLLRFFDIAFRVPLDERWQSPDAALRALDDLLRSDERQDESAIIVDRIRRRVQASPVLHAPEAWGDIRTKLLGALKQGTKAAHASLVQAGLVVCTIHDESSHDERQMRCTVRTGVGTRFGEVRFAAELLVRFSGSEVQVLTLPRAGVPSEFLLQVPFVRDFQVSEDFVAKMKHFYLSGFEAEFDRIRSPTGPA